MKVMTVVGIRPDFIRMSLIIKYLDDAPDINHILIHAGQHYTRNVNSIFFEELGIRRPNLNMGIKSGTHAKQTATLLIEIEKAIDKYKPDLFLCLGDSNTSLSAIVAAKLHVKVAHIEAGMRSYDWRMPEEMNRTIVDHLSDILYVYTQRYRENVLFEGIPSQKIRVVGNPIVDVIQEFLPQALERSVLKDLGVDDGKYILVTAHRAENVDNPKTLLNILKSLELIGFEFDMPVIYPIYYRTIKRMTEFGLKMPECVVAMKPLGFLDFLCLETKALLLVSDSGTVQEEGCILQVPCVTIRISTERPETVEVGANMLAGLEPEDILDCAKQMVDRERNWTNPLGDGKSSKRIVEDLVRSREAILDTRFVPPLMDSRKQGCYSPIFLNTFRDRR